MAIDSAIDLATVRHHLTGPIASVAPAFTHGGDIDEAGLRHIVEFAIAGGVRTVLLTYGDSLFSLLTDDEITLVTRIVAQQTGGRAMVVAADGRWWTGKTAAFADYAIEVGADMLMVLPPLWGGSTSTDDLVNHYTAVAERAPVMVVTGAFAGRNDGLEVCRRLIERGVSNVMAVKDDLSGQFARKLCVAVHDHWAVFAGGQKENHLNMHPYGCDRYMSTFSRFSPGVATAYWHAIKANDLAEATRIIRDIDVPLFERIIAGPGGFDAAIHGLYELAGIAPRWRRPPFHSLTDEELESLRDWTAERSLL